jgi:hypothetical protein
MSSFLFSHEHHNKDTVLKIRRARFMTLLENFIRTSSHQCRDPIYRVRDSSKDVSGRKNLSWDSRDKSADAINRVPTGVCMLAWHLLYISSLLDSRFNWSRLNFPIESFIAATPDLSGESPPMNTFLLSSVSYLKSPSALSCSLSGGDT